MAYSLKARTLRCCKATTKAGEPCRAWAVWGHPDGLCATHAGLVGVPKRRGYTPVQHARYPLCHCAAYAFPHRPGGGLCRWPDPPEYRLPPKQERWP
jgi:hypothetical protein